MILTRFGSRGHDVVERQVSTLRTSLRVLSVSSPCFVWGEFEHGIVRVSKSADSGSIAQRFLGRVAYELHLTRHETRFRRAPTL
jgi:hypothetical protein